MTITVKGDEMLVDLAGTAPQVPDRPINMPFEGTVDCAVWLTLRSILLDSVVYGPIPQNSGLTRPIKIVAPKGCLANPIFPAPVIARFCPGNALADTVMKALAPAVPNQISAGIGNLTVIAFSGVANEQQWVHMEILEGSYGGRHGIDGMDTVDTLYANTRNNPIEDIESHLPLRVDSLRAARGHGGGRRVARRHRLGARVRLSDRRRLLGRRRRAQIQALGLRRRRRRLAERAHPGDCRGRAHRTALESALPQGEGGRPHHRLRTERRRLWSTARPRRRKRCSTTCSTASSRRDLAREQYGVVIAGNAVDEAATKALRAEMGGSK